MSANFVAWIASSILYTIHDTLTRSEAIETYTSYDVTSFRPPKTTIAFFANFESWRDRKIVLRAGLFYHIFLALGLNTCLYGV